MRNARDVMRVKEELTPRQRRIAKFWEAGPGTVLPAGVWNRVAFNYVRDKELSVPRQARLFAMINVAMADAGGACWNAKYLTGWWDPRPINGIRDLGLDKKWKPLLGTPLFPGVPVWNVQLLGFARERCWRASSPTMPRCGGQGAARPACHGSGEACTGEST